MKNRPPLYLFPLALATGLLAASLMFSTGCASNGGLVNPESCAKAQKVYELYQASLLVRQPSADEVKAAKIAATTLTVLCGWTQATLPTPPGARGVPEPQVDENGVPIVLAP